MLALVSSHHVHRLLKQIKVEVLVAKGRSEVEVAIDKCLRPSIEKRIYVGLIPSGLFDRLEFRVKVVEPLADITLIGF